MASSSAPVHPARYLSVFLVMLIGIYLLVFFTGDKHTAPKLGIDLQGGTRVTLTARTPDGSAPSREALAQAQQIISARVNGLGVSGSEVVVDGDNLVITVPGNDGSEARNLGQTARLYIRPVLNSMPAQPAAEEPQPAPSAEPQPPGQPAAPPPAQSGAPASPQPGAQPRPYPQDPAPSPNPTSPASPPPAPPAEAPATDPRKDLAERIAQEKKLRQSTNQYMQMVALQFQATRCESDDILAGNDDPKLPLVTCSTDHKTAYLLAPSIISGDQIQNATSGMDQRGIGYVVDLQFKGPRPTSGPTTPPPISAPRRRSPWTRRLSVHRRSRKRSPAAEPRSAVGIRHSPRRPHASSPTSSSTGRCRCPSNRRKPKRFRRPWGCHRCARA